MRYDWSDEAKCKGQTDLFYPIFSSAALTAKKVCRDCPCKQECLETAIAGDEIGVWGGTTEMERRAIQSRRIRSAMR